MPWEESSAEFAPLFHSNAYTSTLVPRIARGSGAVVVFAFAERVKNGSYRIQWVLGPEEVYDADPGVAAMAVNRGVRRCVKSNPAQYMWTYERFAIQQEGGENPYQGL